MKISSREGSCRFCAESLGISAGTFQSCYYDAPGCCVCEDAQQNDTRSCCNRFTFLNLLSCFCAFVTSAVEFAVLEKPSEICVHICSCVEISAVKKKTQFGVKNYSYLNQI